MMERGAASHTMIQNYDRKRGSFTHRQNDIHKTITEGGTASHRKLGQLNNMKNNSNDILYSSQQEIKAVVRSHNEEHISIIISH